MRACQEVGERLSIVGDDVVDGIRKPSRELEETSAMASCAAVVGPHEESQGVTSLGCHLGPCLENSLHLLEGHWDATDTEPSSSVHIQVQVLCRCLDEHKSTRLDRELDICVHTYVLASKVDNIGIQRAIPFWETTAVTDKRGSQKRESQQDGDKENDLGNTGKSARLAAGKRALEEKDHGNPRHGKRNADVP